MSRHHFYFTPLSGRDVQAAPRRGLTLIEILIAVALMTIIMLASVQVLSYVSAELNRAQNAMVLAGRVRGVQLQIQRDLDCITAPLNPPLRFDDAQGYFCYIEGLGSHYGNLYHADNDGNDKIGWALKDIAFNSETGGFDSTVDDCDDILMFTARAPGDSMFRGLVGGKMTESKKAEICIFLRGTTLYRRVLLIIPDEQLQEVLRHTDYTSGATPARKGYGFYRDFDVSVRLEWNDDESDWLVKANTLADLTRRENRFGHALNNQNINGAGNPNPFPYSIHNNGAWYHLRLPTLAECTMLNNCSWRAGTQIAQSTAHYNLLSNKRSLVYDDESAISSYGWATGFGVASFPKEAGCPYIDYWNYPLPWNGEQALSNVTQSLVPGTPFYDEPSSSTPTFRVKEPRVNEDVLMTNVIGFDIKGWHPDAKKFIDLGEFKTDFELATPDANDARRFSKDLGSQGFYGRLFSTTNGCYGNDGTKYRYGLLACVYDTWTDAYENAAAETIFNITGSDFLDGIASDPAYDGIVDIMEHVDRWKCPPPYNVPLTGLQIKIRVFDPGTNNIREVTIRKNFN